MGVEGETGHCGNSLYVRLLRSTAKTCRRHERLLEFALAARLIQRLYLRIFERARTRLLLRAERIDILFFEELPTFFPVVL